LDENDGTEKERRGIAGSRVSDDSMILASDSTP
jgi:hypothetical protein